MKKVLDTEKYLYTDYGFKVNRETHKMEVMTESEERMYTFTNVLRVVIFASTGYLIGFLLVELIKLIV